MIRRPLRGGKLVEGRGGHRRFEETEEKKSLVRGQSVVSGFFGFATLQGSLKV